MGQNICNERSTVNEPWTPAMDARPFPRCECLEKTFVTGWVGNLVEAFFFGFHQSSLDRQRTFFKSYSSLRDETRSTCTRWSCLHDILAPNM